MFFRLQMPSALCVAIAATSPANAQDDPFDLGTLILSGGITPIDAAGYGRSSTVLTAEDIDERGITTVREALRAVPGLSVSSAGDSFTQVRIRGGEANHTLILIDGIRAAGGDNPYVLSGLETANIERIEVLRGPQSVYYGSEASAGVINIVTRRGGIGTEASGTLEFGGATTATAFLSRRDERGGVSLSLSYSDDYGYDLSGDNGEADGILRRTAFLSGDYMVTENLKLGFTLRRSEEDYEFDLTNWAATDSDSYVIDDPNQYATRDEMTAEVFAEYRMFDERMSHRLGFQLTENDESINGAAPTRTRTESLNYRLSYALDGRTVDDADHLLNFLIDDRKDSSSSNPLYDRASTSYALEYRGSLVGGLDLQAGVRFDDNSVFEDITTWNAAVSYTFDNDVRLHASAGTGSVNPTYFELYASDFGYVGNPALTPERNESFDIGVELPVLAGRGTVDVTYFNERLHDEITDVATGGGTFTLINQTGVSTREGIELSGEIAATEVLDLRMSYTYLDARNPDGSIETRRPRHELALGATVDAFGGRGSVSADVRHVAGNFDTQFWGAFQTAELPAYTTVDVAARYAIDERFTLTGRVENLFDAETMDVWGYAGRPLTAYVGVEARF